MPCHAPGHAAIAPSRMVSAGSGTSDASVASCTRPSPWHCGHAPAGVFGENASESSRGAPGGYVPARDISMRSEFDRVVTVPTVERELGMPRACCSATAGGRPLIERISGAPAWRISRRAYGATDSR